jgi:hypothetical protein
VSEFLFVPRYPNTSCFRSGSVEEIEAACSAILKDHFAVVNEQCHSDVYTFLFNEDGKAGRAQRRWAIQEVAKVVLPKQLEQYWKQLADSQLQVCSNKVLFWRLSPPSREVLKKTEISSQLPHSDRKAVVQALVEARDILKNDAHKAREQQSAQPVPRQDSEEMVFPRPPQESHGENPKHAVARARKRERSVRDREIRAGMRGAGKGGKQKAAS